MPATKYQRLSGNGIRGKAFGDAKGEMRAFDSLTRLQDASEQSV